MCRKILLSFIVICVLLLTTMPATAQIFYIPVTNESDTDSVKMNDNVLYMRAEVKDHIDHEPLKGVRAELLYADSSFADTVHVEYVSDTTWNYKYSAILAPVKKSGRYIIKVEHDDYVTQFIPFEVKKLYKRERSRDLPTVYLRRKPKRNEYDLEGVVIKATKLKFYMDGDTLVYDADAFNMAEGSMLDGLMKKLPGVSLEDGGVIKVNGRQVDALLLNGKNFFNSDRELLLENMPAYMVKNIRSYERLPENAVGAMREKTTKKELVMDVKLKREYNRGWLANADIGGGATFFRNDEGELDGKFLGRLFGLRFDDRSRLALYFNANNLNDYRVPGEKGEWSPLTQSQGVSTRYNFGGNYRLENEEHSHETSVNGSYADLTDENQASSATFLENGDTYGKSLYSKRSYDCNVNARYRYNYNRQKPVGELLKNVYAYFSPSFQYMRWNNHSTSASATFNDDVSEQLGKAWMDSIQAPNAGELMRHYAINRTLSRTKGTGHYLSSENEGALIVTPAHNDFMSFELNYEFNFNSRHDETFDHYRLDYPNSDMLPTDYRNRYTPIQNRTRELRLTPQFSFMLDRNYHHSVDITYDYSYKHNDSRNPLYLLNKLDEWKDLDAHKLGTLPSVDEMLSAIDTSNSSYTRRDVDRHTASVSYRWQKFEDDKLSYLSLGLNLPTEVERMKYQQGIQVDTLMRRTTTFLNPSVMYMFQQFKEGKSLMLNYSISHSAPSMVNLLNVRNDNNPLYVTLGNPNLKNTRSHSLWGQYTDKFGRTLVNANTNVSVTENAVASGFIYDKETGVQTVTPENVNGNWNASLSAGADIPLDKDEKWRIKEDLSYSFNHSVDLNGTNETMVATKSVVKSGYLTEGLTLTWRPTSKMEYELNGKLNYQRSTSNRSNFTNLNVYTYQYGARMQLELPWDIQISSDITMYSRRGYSEQSMNTNELVWNARVAKRLMHGNLTIMFDGFDLLGNLSNVRRYINAQGRSETFYNVIPSYGLLQVVWRLNKQPKKK